MSDIFVFKGDMVKVTPFKRKNGSMCGNVIVKDDVANHDLSLYPVKAIACKSDGSLYDSEVVILSINNALKNLQK